MNPKIRSAFLLSALAVVMVACGTTVAAPASETPEPTRPATPVTTPTPKPSVAPSEAPTEAPTDAPSEAPAEPAPVAHDVVGTLTIAEAAFSGPGATIQEALDNGPSGEYPTLVNGVIFLDTDGRIYLATAVSDTSAPTFEGPMLEVLNAPNDGPSWDMANAELLGLEEANGIIFNQDVQVLGFLEIR